MKKAILFGSNGPDDLNPLRYALEDVRQLSECFAQPQCGFQVILAPAGMRAHEVRNFIERTTEDCDSQDTVLCYFSGHGTVDQGNLFLLWDDTQSNRLLGSAIPAEDVLRAMRLCRAQNKLLILDCCRAGSVLSRFGFKDAGDIGVQETIYKPDNFLILMASSKLESARELDKFGGSFLAHSIVEVLDSRVELEAFAEHQRLSVHGLATWLDFLARKYNEEHKDTPVPIPFLFGKSKGDFYITVGPEDWASCSLNWPDGSEMIVLPLRFSSHSAICLSRFPITNKQYREVVAIEPCGKEYVKTESSGEWIGPFYPWRDQRFADDDLPVVCVSYNDAQRYVEAVNAKTVRGRVTLLPRTSVWNFAAFGTMYPPPHPRTWLSISNSYHHMADRPIRVDSTGQRANRLGISDLVGNIWEWCSSWKSEVLVAISIYADHEQAAVMGGGFLDDLNQGTIFLDARDLLDAEETRHTDLGFRIAGLIRKEELPEAVQVKLTACPDLYDWPSASILSGL